MIHPRTRTLIGRIAASATGLLLVGSVAVYEAPGTASAGSLPADSTAQSSDVAADGHHFGFSSVLNQSAATPPQREGKVCVAHRTGSGRTNLIEVSQNAVPAHQQHGDQVVGPAPCPRQ